MVIIIDLHKRKYTKRPFYFFGEETTIRSEGGNNYRYG